MTMWSKLLSAFIALVMSVGMVGSASADSVIDDVVKRGKLVVGLATNPFTTHKPRKVTVNKSLIKNMLI